MVIKNYKNVDELGMVTLEKPEIRILYDVDARAGREAKRLNAIAAAGTETETDIKRAFELQAFAHGSYFFQMVRGFCLDNDIQEVYNLSPHLGAASYHFTTHNIRHVGVYDGRFETMEDMFKDIDTIEGHVSFTPPIQEFCVYTDAKALENKDVWRGTWAVRTKKALLISNDLIGWSGGAERLGIDSWNNIIASIQHAFFHALLQFPVSSEKEIMAAWDGACQKVSVADYSDASDGRIGKVGTYLFANTSKIASFVVDKDY